MKAITVLPGTPASVRLDERPEPAASKASLLVQAIALGVCGTDREIISGSYGWPPDGQDRLILGHESLGRVIEAPDGCDFKKGDLVVGIVRRPDPVPCTSCAVMEWDMCRNGQYTERGIKQVDGFGAERFRLEPEFTVKVAPALGMLGVLLEPSTILAKAWDHIERIGHRTKSWSPKTVPGHRRRTGWPARCLMGKQRGLDVHVMDIVENGAKPIWCAISAAPIMCASCPTDLRPTSSSNVRARCPCWPRS